MASESTQKADREILDDSSVARITEQLFHDPQSRVYAVLDGASIPDLLPTLEQTKPPYECLFRGEQPPEVLAVAPYLVELIKGSDFTDWVVRSGWGQHWGVFAITTAEMRTMSRHFRTMMQVRSPEGKIVYFRFYDPRVLRVYLPTCDERESPQVFGPIEWYGAEAKDRRAMLRFRSGSDRPVQESFAVRFGDGAVAARGA